MHKLFALIIVFLVSINLVSGQELGQTIKGTVIDADSKEVLAGASVIITNTIPQRGASTDLAGRFQIQNINPGRYRLQVMYIGYEDVFINELLVGSGKEVVLNIEMLENVLKSAAIVFTVEVEKDKALNQMAVVSARAFTVEETQRYATSINDPSRLAQSFAGVSTSDDENNELVIRGNSPRGMLWRMEGIEIPNPNHFSDGEGASGGGVSMLSSNVMTNSDFFTGAFPAEYGNALSGVFDIKLRKGNSDKREFAVQTGVMGADVSAEGPFSKNGNSTYLFNYRYSTLTFLNKMGITIGDDEIIPRFQDLSFKLHAPTKHLGTLSLFGLGGISDAGDSMAKDSLELSEGIDRFGEIEEHQMGVIGLSDFYAFANKKTYLKSILSYSSQTHTVTNDSADANFQANQFYEESFTSSALRASVLLNHKLSSSHVFRSGIIYSRLGYDAYSHESLGQGSIEQTLIDEDGSTGLAQAYTQWKWRPSNSLTFNSGIHYSHFLLNDNSSLEPRFGVRWGISHQQSVNFGMGLHSRVETISNYLSDIILEDGSSGAPNENLNLTKSFHTVLGYDNSITRNMRLKLETYYQHLYDVPIGKGANSTISSLNFNEGFATIPLYSEGVGTNYGVELTLEKFLSDNYYFLGTASLYNSKFEDANGNEWNSAFNGNYVFNVLGGKEYFIGNNNNILGFNGRFILKGGNRLTPIDIDQSIANGHTTYDMSRIFEERVDDYFRLDFGISYRKNNPGYAWILSLDIQNATNRENIAGEYFDLASRRMRQTFMVGLVPILNYKIEF